MTTKPFKLLLAEDADLNNLKLPGLLSPKLDGVRAYVKNGVVLTRSNKPLANLALQKKFAHLENFDGELIYGSPTAPDVYTRTYSAVSTINGSPDDVKFFVFDYLEDLDAPYEQRYRTLLDRMSHMLEVLPVIQYPVNTMEDMIKLESEWLEHGYEGAMLRDPNARYKQGRSTLNEAILLKIKRFESAECRVLRFVEAMQNTNEAKINATGHTERSSHKAGMVGKGTLGAIDVVGLNGRFKDVEFTCGFAKGFSHKIRKEMWDDPDAYIGRAGTFTFFPIGCKDKPRFPQWSGLCSMEDK